MGTEFQFWKIKSFEGLLHNTLNTLNTTEPVPMFKND